MPRSFSRNINTSYDVEYWDYGGSPPNVVFHGYYPKAYTLTLPTRQEQRTFAGTRYPNYRTFRSVNGYLPTLPCHDSYHLQEALTVKRMQHYPHGANMYRMVGASTLSSDVNLAFDYTLSDECWSKLRRKVLDQDFNLPVFLAEGKKTIDMVADRVRSLTLAYTYFRRGRFRDVARHLGLSKSTVHNTWLEYKYGWIPLLMDIHGAAKTLAYQGFKRSQYTFRASVGKQKTLSRSGNDLFTGVVSYQAKAWVTVRVKSHDVTMQNRIGLLNPLVITWELLPFSFVVDWFVNIGDCLAELTAFSGVTILDGGSSTKTIAVGLLEQYNASPWDTRFKSRLYTYDYHRTPGVETIPTLRVRSNPLDLSRLTTSIALLTQAFGRK